MHAQEIIYNYFLNIYGNGNEESNLKLYVKQNNLKKNIKFKGFRKNIMKKLAVKSSAELTLFAVDNTLIQLPF